MELVAIVIILALVEFMGFSIAVGRARIKYGIAAPATTGNEQFERLFRIQMNTLEQLVIFIPALLISAHYFNAVYAAAAGAVFLIARLMYFFGYAADPSRRSRGFGIGFLAIVFLLITGLIGAVRGLI